MELNYLLPHLMKMCQYLSVQEMIDDDNSLTTEDVDSLEELSEESTEEVLDQSSEEEDECITSQDIPTIKENNEKINELLYKYPEEAKKLSYEPNERIQMLQASNAALKCQLNTLIAENKKLTSAMSKCNKEKSELKAQFEQSEQKANEYKKDIDKFNRYSRGLEEDQTKLLGELKTVKQKVKDAKIDLSKEKLKRIRFEMDAYSKLIKKLKIQEKEEIKSLKRPKVVASSENESEDEYDPLPRKRIKKSTLRC